MQPLAERLRPKTLDEYAGQKHLIGKGSILRNYIESGKIPSIILWGPPGVGKTTLATIISNKLNRPFFTLSAVSSGVKDVRNAIDKAEKLKFFNNNGAILFIDEIHRFSKSQQDSLLGAVENGTITLIGATTENPSFEVITPLLSRCQVYVLKSLEEHELKQLLERAIGTDTELKKCKFEIKQTDALFRFSGGDARKLYNIIELIVNNSNDEAIIINNENVINVLQTHTAEYDKKGEMHYDIISAFIKSIRGSDPNASVYWLARMLDGGEDIKFIARRLVILASEDIGLANPNALLLANTCFDAINKIGMPEARIILSQTTIYLATSEKSNSAYSAINTALELVAKTGNLSIPLHLRNAPTSLMKKLNYGKDYKYSHNYANNFAEQQFLPDKIKNKIIYSPQKNQFEIKILTKLKSWWSNRYKYDQ